MNADTTPTTTTNARPRVAFFAALGFFALVNLGLFCFHNAYQPPIASAVLNSNPKASIHRKEWTWWLARRWLEQTTPPDVVLFGSSQIGSAHAAADAQHLLRVVDALTHRHASLFESDLRSKFGRSVSVFSLASPGAMCSDAFMASKALFRKDFQPKVVIIGISPRDFIDASMPYCAATEPYKFYSRYVHPGKLIWSAYNDAMSWLQCAHDSLPCRRLGNYVEQVLAQESADGVHENIEEIVNARTAILGAGEAEPGKWLVPANIPSTLWVDNTKEYKNRFRNPNTPVYQAERTFFNAFLTDMQSRGITVLVVGMPSLQMNRDLLSHKFWTNFRQYVSTACTLHNAQFLDLTDSPVFVKADYLDTVHLNAYGGSKLFRILSDYALADPLVAARLNGSGQPLAEGTQTAAPPTVTK